ncbi:MAG: NAD(P)/FAD-dependent oxidoreductase [Candidatus Tectomicrobia bacterium]|uniref:NAD(P)/FAD-dependent oxidoreductase n=1 Tax=Tectimicrobiota bacterium TaxID=2528274 RepID=A0A932HY05_UNCTE|nr:NAD(P)/FAD-dependent oxidoreductase [Candidatus Tectomicrobia bacterium]
MAKNYDLVVIGTGSAASSAAAMCRSAGWSVAVVDSRPFGGTCALRGCDPKKVLVGAAEAADHARRLHGKGFTAERIGIHWQDLIRFKRSFTEPMPGKMEKNYNDKGIETYHGRARFTGKQSLQVENEALEARHVVIATGARPATLGIPGEEHLTTSEQFLDLEELPRRMLLVGGGYIAFEFAHVASRAGSQVTVLHRGKRVLGGFDPDLTGQLLEKSRRLGIVVHLETEVSRIEKQGSAFLATAKTNGSTKDFGADLVVHAAGRVPEIDDLNLGAAHVEHERGVKVNDYLQSVSNPAVYAAGDAAESGPPLTPVAAHEGTIVARNLLEGNKHKPNHRGVPSVVFTIPPLAGVGLQEGEANRRGLKFRVSRGDSSGWYTSRRIGEDCAGYKILIEEGTERILGAHLLGPGAEETINLFALAIRNGLTSRILKDMIFAYPTATSDIAYML